MKHIIDQLPDLPRHAPVMVLPGGVLLPNAMQKLHIFEPRYRAMLQWSLEADRMFCIALIKRGRSDWSTTEDFHHIAGIGLIRACVARDDGTSDLILQGVARVEFTDFNHDEPYVMAELRPLPTPIAKPKLAADLTAQVIALCSQYHANGMSVPDDIDKHLAKIESPGVLADFVGHSFLRDSFRKQSLLATGDVSVRLRKLIAFLRAEMP